MPVTVIVYDPVGVLEVVEIESVLVKVGFPLVGLTDAVNPAADGEIEVERLTDCVAPLTSETVTVELVPLPCVTLPLEGLRPTEKSNVPEDPNAPTWLITVFQFWNVESARYSDSNQKVEAEVGVGSVAAAK